MEISYGTRQVRTNIVSILSEHFQTPTGLLIPPNDKFRCQYFGDPAPGEEKKIFITLLGNMTFEYDDQVSITIDLQTGFISVKTDPYEYKLRGIQSTLKLQSGSLNDEMSEQRMACRFLKGNEKILELGGNIGRNSCVIAAILAEHNNNNLVVLESDPDSAAKLVNNRDINHLKFHVEAAALSKRNLIQKEWDTIPSDIVLPGYKKVDTITLEGIYEKYNIPFDTLVLDCEGAFYYILLDYPNILDNIKLIIMENDYQNIEHKHYLDQKLKEKGFECIYSRGYEKAVCASNFWETWRRV